MVFVLIAGLAGGWLLLRWALDATPKEASLAIGVALGIILYCWIFIVGVAAIVRGF